MLPAKFLPGAGNLVAAASGFSCLRLRTFVLMDGLGLLVWASVYSGAGWLFSAQVEGVIEWASSFTMWLVAAGSALIAGAATWRVAKVHMHKAAHEAMLATDPSRSEDTTAPAVEVGASV